MAKKRNSRKKFLAPLPITLSTEVYGALPTLYPHNPVSWVLFGFKYAWMYFKPVPQTLISDIHIGVQGGIFKVESRQDMTRLWDYGFFGKGTLSRSDPTWASRTNRRLHLEQDGEGFELSNEEITKLRREERVKFKAERSKEQELEKKRRAKTITEEESQQLTAIKDILTEFRKSNRLKIKQERELTILFDLLRQEDQDIVDEKQMKLKQDYEYLQLEPVEVFFLKFGLGIVDVAGFPTNMDLFLHGCCGSDAPKPNNNFIIQYMVYHHYRSLGWCARSGIKFGCDYVLYKRGPPYSHAEHAVLILTTDGTIDKSLIELYTISRVIGSVKKSLVLTYVDIPTEKEFNEVLFNESLNDQKRFISLCKLYNISEVLYRRWVPNRTRD